MYAISNLIFIIFGPFLQFINITKILLPSWHTNVILCTYYPMFTKLNNSKTTCTHFDYNIQHFQKILR